MRDELGDGVAAEERLAEPPGRDVAEPAHVLHGQRIAEPEIRHDADAVRGAHLRVPLDAQDGDERVAGQDPEDHEHAERDAEQRDHRVRRAACQILLHPQ